MVETLTYAEQFQRDSYLYVPAVFGQFMVTRLAADVDAYGNEAAPWAGGWSLTARHGIHDRSDVWHQAVTDPKLVAIVEECLGGRAVIDQSTTVVKPPQNGQPFPMHQDSAFYGHGTQDYVIVTVYLDAMTPENGPIQFVPGSHQRGHRAHVREGNTKAHLPNVTLAESVPVYAKPGDVTLFHIHTIHGSAPNLSSTARRTVRLGYRRG